MKIKNSKLKIKNSQEGFAAFYVAIIVLIIMAGIALTLLFLVVNQQKILSNSLTSYKSFSVTESGIEDALLRLSKDKKWFSPYNLTLGTGASNVEISDIIGGARTITSTGNVNNRIRKVRVVYKISTEDVSFYYGIQVGALGLQMTGNAVVYGNIFSNGPITGASNTKIYGDAISAGPAGLINTMRIKKSSGKGGNAWAATITGGDKCVIDGDAHYTTSIDCDTVGGSTSPGTPVTPQDMPITQEKITSWQNDAVAGGTIAGYSLGGNNTDSLGPVKVDGDMTLDSNAKLTITGTIWVTGNLSLNSNAVILLDPGYSSFSGVIVVNGHISASSNVVFCGSEGYKGGGKCNSSVGSYIMLLSIDGSDNPSNPAIYATSNTKTAILYASNGLIKLGSNAKLKEATGFGIYMDSNAEVTYETGLADIRFSSGPGGGWKVASWKEIE